MNKEQLKLKNNKKARIFLGFLALSVLFWLLIKLSRVYETSAKANVAYVNFPKDKLLQSEPIKTLDITLKGIGFSLFRSKITTPNIEVSLTDIKRKKGSLYYCLSSNLQDQISTNFSKATITRIKPDTLFFNLGKSVTKKVPVKPNILINYQVGFNLSGNLTVEPDFITISGPENLVDTIKQITTLPIDLQNINEDIDKEVELKLFEEEDTKLSYSDKKIIIKGKVEKFTERKLKVNFNIKNLPKDVKINTFPKEVELVFSVGLSDFNKVTEKDFTVVCDYAESTKNELSYLIPRVKNKSKKVKEIKIVPNQIDFLIEK